MATVDPIRFSNMENILRLSAVISQEINLLLKDNSNLRNTPLLSYQGSINGTGSDTVRVRLAGLDGFDSMSAAGSEISDESANKTALTINSADLIAARQYIIYEMSDLASMTGFGGSDIDPFRIAQSIAGSYETRFAALTGAAAASSIAIVASLGTALLTTGVSMAVTGVTNMLFPQQQPTVGDVPSGLSETDARVNYSFNGIQNVSRSGVCIPLIFGEVFCGSIVVSSGTDTAPVFKE